MLLFFAVIAPDQIAKEDALERQVMETSVKTVNKNIKESDFLLDKYLNREIAKLFKDVIKIILKDPSQASFFLKTYRKQKKAGKLRLEWEKKGVHVPPFMIFSITGRCNLSCKGCYAREFNRKKTDEIEPEKMQQIIQEAHDLGTSIILIA